VELPHLHVAGVVGRGVEGEDDVRLEVPEARQPLQRPPQCGEPDPLGRLEERQAGQPEVADDAHVFAPRADQPLHRRRRIGSRRIGNRRIARLGGHAVQAKNPPPGPRAYGPAIPVDRSDVIPAPGRGPALRHPRIDRPLQQHPTLQRFGRVTDPGTSAGTTAGASAGAGGAKVR
jgi:hypothetical protein